MAGLLVVAGLGAQMARAAGPAPEVSVAQNGTYLAGEDLSLSVTFTGNTAAGAQYNLSTGVVLPQAVDVVDSGTLGAPVVYPGRTLPLHPTNPAPRIALPGNYTMSADECEALGLEPWALAQTTGSCVVPDGKQYLVFQNISDLPSGASTTHTVTLRPDAEAFPVGSRVELDVTAFTSAEERYIPVFPGSTGIAAGAVHTSDPGVPTAPTRTTSVLVNALRLEKSQPTPENELLRGVHTNSTTYTLRVWHTGEGDIGDVVVTDFIPAGLEYLGLGGAVSPDQTTNANGTQGGGAASVEYPGAARLDGTPPPAPSTYSGPDAIDLNRNAAQPNQETVSTRVATAADAAAHPGVVAGDVYTVVTWNIGELAAAGLVDYSILNPVGQTFPDTAGEAGFFEIRYRAAVPLFENTVDFDGAGNQPIADGGRHQIANLDNNRGASTRHGSAQTVPGFDDDGDARHYVNTATASGVYAGEVADEADRVVTDTDTEGVDAVDVRVLKSVDNEEFTQGNLATYTLNIRTSEYTSAQLSDGGPVVRPNRLVDDLGDGICPVFPADVVVTPNANPNHAGIPNFIIGDPNNQAAIPDEDKGLSREEWNAALGADLASVCGFPSSHPNAALTGLPGTTTLTGIAYDPSSGHFYLDLYTAPLDANTEQVITYTALQNEAYAQGSGEPGATTSGDVIVNTAEFVMTTESIPALDGVGSASGATAEGVWRAWDDSDAVLEARLSQLSKHVLVRSAGVPSRGDIASDTVAGPDDENWVKTPEENEPYAVGDEVWYRIMITPPVGADVRNPKFTDFLPAGVTWDPAVNIGTGRPENMWIVPSNYDRGIGDCTPATVVEWLDTFAPFDVDNDFEAEGNFLTFNLGSDKCFPGSGNTDRFLPLSTTLEIYLKVTVVDAAAFATVDLPQNLAKYQQNNVDGEIFFLRDMAEIEVDGGPRLLKGIRSNSNADSLPGEYPYNSNVDGDPDFETVVQHDQVTFRLDVSAPRTATTNYQIWDALPVGITAADITPGSYTAAEVSQVWTGTPGSWVAQETPVLTGWTATAYDYDAGSSSYPGAPSEVNDYLRAEIKNDHRSIILWNYTGSVPGSIAADDSSDPAIPGAFQGITLGYTVTIPDGTTGSDPAELTQRYVNDASIVQFAYRGNDGVTNNEVIVNGTENLADERHPAAGSGVFELDDQNNDASDPSSVYVVGTDIEKKLISTEIGPLTPTGPDGTVGLNDLDPNNGQTQIVQGEYATFEYSVTIPANTTVRNAVLADDGRFTRSGTNYDYEFVNAAYFDGPAATDTIDCGSLATEFRCENSPGDGRHGVLTFPDEYTNSTAIPQTFRAQVTVWMKDRDVNNPAPTPDLANGWTLTNTARFGFTNPNDPATRVSYSDDAQVQYIDPNLRVVKSASPRTNVAANTDVVYTIQVHNPNLAPAPNARPISFDNIVTDTVPVGLVVDPASFRIGTSNSYASATPISAGGAGFEAVFGGAGITTGLGGTIEWSHERSIALKKVPATVYLFYTAKIDPTTGAGRIYQNDVKVTGSTLPETRPGADPRRGERGATDSETITATTAAISKGVRVVGAADYGASASAPVGQTMQYKVDVTLNANINYYDARVTDVLPAGFTLQGTPTLMLSTGGGTPVDVTADWTRTPTGQTSVWTYTATGADGDLLSDPQARVLSITYDVLLSTGVSGNGPLTNTAKFEWATQNGGSLITPPPTATANVSILNPLVAIDKKVDGFDTTATTPRTYNPDGSFTYTIDVRNSGTATANRTPAYNTAVRDVVPAGVVVDPDSITPVPSNLAAIRDDLEAGIGATIVWESGIVPTLYPSAQANPPAQPNTFRLSYTATFVDAATLTTAVKTNLANVTHFSSFGTGGRDVNPPLSGVGSIGDRADVQPRVPAVVLAKTVSDQNAEGDVAYVGQPFWWNLRATNTGAGDVRNLSLSDTLPLNWSYDATRQAQIRVNGGAWQSIAIPEISLSDPRDLTWTQTQIRAALGLAATPATPVIPGGSSTFVEIRFSAIPQTGALTDAGVTTDAGVPVPHTNTLTAVATDTRGDTGLGGGTYSPDTDTADAFLHAADLEIVKGKGIDAPIKAGESRANAWTITVTNNGPDTAVGPISVTDTTGALPAGITVTGASGTGWDCAVPSRNVSTGETTFSCVRTNANESLAAGASFPVINVAVSVAADQAATTVDNTATVQPGTTHDTDPTNNEDDEDLSTSTEADLAIAKVISTPAAPSVLVAGGQIAWQITARNLGPSDSVSGTTKITITDVIPAGVRDVTAHSNASWVASATRGGAPVGDLTTLQPGDIVTWTYQGARIAGGTPGTPTLTTPVSLTGTVLPSQTTAITNAAVVHPGDTPDPNYISDPDDPDYPDQNNYDQVTSDVPTSAAILSIDKTRVVPDGAGGFRPADPALASDKFVAGDPVHYRITVTNLGISDATDVTVVDETPVGLSYATHAVDTEWIYTTGGATSAFPGGAPTGRTFGTFALVGDQAPGSVNARSFVVTYDTDPAIAPTTVVENWAEVTSGNWDPNDPTGEDFRRDDDRTDATVITDLSIEKSHTGGDVFTPGDMVTYALAVRNNGPSATPGAITITDTLPAGMSYVDDSAAITTPTGNTVPADANPVLSGTDDRVLTWQVLETTELFGVHDDAVAGSGEIIVTYRVRISPTLAAGVDLPNVATVSGTQPDSDPSNNRDDDEVTTGPTSATMTLQKQVQASDGSWVELTDRVAGTNATWRVTITNSGPSAVPVVFTDTIPAGLTITGVTGSTGWDCDTATATCSYIGNGGLHPVGSSEILITSSISANIAPTPAPGLINWGQIIWQDGTHSESERTVRDDAAITVSRVADLGVVKTALSPVSGLETTSVVAGETIWYDIVLTNHGESAAVGPLVVNDVLPAGVSYQSMLTTGWDVTVDTVDPRLVTFTRTAGLAVGASSQIRFIAAVAPSAASGVDLVNVATIDDDTLDANNDDNPVNDSDDAPVTPERRSSVSIDKGHVAATPDEFEIGDEVEFTLDVSNASAGPSNASGIVVTDTLPAGLDYVGLSGTDWSLAPVVDPDTNPTVNVDGTTTVRAVYAGELAPGATAPRLTITAQVTVAIGDATSVTNGACVTGLGTGETNTHPDPCDTDTVAVVPLADLVILKTVDPAVPVSAGQPIAWEIAVGNLGPSNSLSTTANPITVTDTVPTGISGVADPSQGDWTASLTRPGDPAATWPATAGDTITWTFADGGIIPSGYNPRPGADPDSEPANPFVTLRLTGTLDAAWIDGDPISNTAAVVPGVTRDPEPGPDSNESTVTVTTPGDETDVRIGKTRVVQDDEGDWVPATTPFVPGDDISYRIIVINDGPAVARDVVVVDETPEGLAYKEHESVGAGVWTRTEGGETSVYPDGAPAGRTFDTFALDARQQVGPDNARVFVVTYTTDPAMQHSDADPLINWAEVTADNDTVFDEDEQRDSSDASSVRHADLSMVKTHTAPAEGVAAVAGETIEYRLLVTNHGPSVSDQPIAVTDTLPAGFSYVAGSGQISVAGAAAEAVEPDAIVGQNVTWSDITDGADLAVNSPTVDGTVVITFTALIDSDRAPEDGVLNAALVDGPNDENPLNDRDTDPVDIVGSADLAIGKAVVTAPDEITAGQPITWLLTPRNLGPSASESTAESPITVTDTLPAGILRLVVDPSNADWTATVSNAGGWAAATAGDTITWTFTGASFVVGAEPDITVTALIDPAWTGGAIVNRAVIAPGETPDPLLPNNESSTSVTPGDRTALSIWKNRMVQVDGEWVLAALLDPVPDHAPGADITYRLDVRNDGPAVARDVQVVDPVPAGLSDPRVTAYPGGGEWTGATAACEDGLAELAGYPATECLTASLAGPLTVGTTASFLVTFATDPALDPAEPIVNWAQARGTNVPPVERPSDEESTHGTAMADLSIVKTTPAEHVLAGSVVDYRLVVTNEGPSISRGPVTVTDLVPVGMSYVTGSALVAWTDGTELAIEPTITDQAGSQLLTWTPVRADESLAPGETVVITLQTQLAEGLFTPAGSAGLQNLAHVSSPDDPNPLNDDADATVIVDPLATLVVEKTAVGAFQVGGTGTFLITVTNLGPTDDPGPITVTDALPAGLTFHSSPDENVAVAGTVVTWTLPEGLAVGERADLTLVVNVGKGAHPEVTNTAVVDTPTTLTPESVTEDSVTVQVAPLPPIAVTGDRMITGGALAIALLLLLGGAMFIARRRRESA